VGSVGYAGVWVTNDEGGVLLSDGERREGWSEPTGKHRPEERLEETARRRVREETEYVCHEQDSDDEAYQFALLEDASTHTVSSPTFRYADPEIATDGGEDAIPLNRADRVVVDEVTTMNASEFVARFRALADAPGRPANGGAPMPSATAPRSAVARPHPGPTEPPPATVHYRPYWCKS
jgi:ADP-ribose pyrophosphatase YjhB (NUDIX family)